MTTTGKTGEILSGRYELVAVLGAGGMGEVWRARHLALDKPVAVKILRLEAASARERLLREARLLASLKHEALVEVFDVGETSAHFPYFVMELLDGTTVAARLDEKGRFPPYEAVNLGVALSHGLAAAHAAGVIHRDVKPDNVILVERNGTFRPKLIDFGVALARRQLQARMTVSGGVVGTPEYMAPEMIRGAEPGPTADVWGLAITLYEMLVGTSPFASDDIVTIFKRVLDDPLPYPRDSAVLDPQLWAILSAALRKAPAERTPTVEAFSSALQAWLREAPRTRTAPSAAFDRRIDSSDDEDAPHSLDHIIRKKLGLD